MRLPFEYEQLTIGEYGGTTPTTTDFEHARVVILPIPLDRTTSYVPGTRNGPHEILVASSHMELWDEETQTDVHSIGIFTLPEMEFPFASMDEVVRRDSARHRGAGQARQVPVILGGEHSITPAGRRRRGGEVSRAVGAANRRARRSARVVHGNAAQPRVRDAAHARVRADDAGRASAACRPRKRRPCRRCRPQIFYDFNMRDDADWIERVVDSLSEHVYITIDVDGLDPAIMPATGTPEPGGLSWYEALALLRRVIERRTVVGCDVVELSPMPGHVAPNFLCAKLVYKILSYRFGPRLQEGAALQDRRVARSS